MIITWVTRSYIANDNEIYKSDCSLCDFKNLTLFVEKEKLFIFNFILKIWKYQGTKFRKRTSKYKVIHKYVKNNYVQS